jgi:hypothetical protein
VTHGFDQISWQTETRIRNLVRVFLPTLMEHLSEAMDVFSKLLDFAAVFVEKKQNHSF